MFNYPATQALGSKSIGTAIGPFIWPYGYQLSVTEIGVKTENSVLEGNTDAYASVARAHTGYLNLHSDLALEVVTVSSSEKAPAFGSFGFSLSDNKLRAQVDDILAEYLGSAQHRSMMKAFGFTDGEVDLVVGDDQR